MKKIYVLLSLLAFTALVLASPKGPPYNKKIPPRLSLPMAYQIALKELGASTNQCYCVSANIITDFGQPSWSFVFSTTNVNLLDDVIVVKFDGTVFEDNGFR